MTAPKLKPLTYGSTATAHCRPCRKVTTWTWAGYENHDRPRIDHWRCMVDGFMRMQMADVTDAENLCKTILDRQLAGKNTDLSPSDRADVLQLVLAECMDLYNAWDPSRGVRFTAYATGLLRLRVNNWWRQELGRDVPKAMTGALSLDAPTVEDGSELASFVAAGTGDPEMDRDSDLYWALARGGRAVVQPLPPADHGERRGPVEAAAGRKRGVGRKQNARTSTRAGGGRSE